MIRILLFIPLLAFAADKREVFHYQYAGKEIEMPVIEVEGIKVNDLCAKKCRALEIFRGTSQAKGFSGGKQGNYAGAYCEKMGGAQLLAHRPGEAGRLFCVFADLSAIESESLLAHHLRTQK